MTGTPITLGVLIQKLQGLAALFGDDAPVYIHDADTDWSLPLENHPQAVRLGTNHRGDGVEGGIMLQASYHGM